jgi:predicted nucleic-acid-binding protein
LIQLLTADDPKQGRAAKSLLATGPVWIAKTVLLETAWVLRILYGFEENVVRDALTNWLGLKNVRVEVDSSVATALALAAHGIEPAGAMHFEWQTAPC